MVFQAQNVVKLSTRFYLWVLNVFYFTRHFLNFFKFEEFFIYLISYTLKKDSYNYILLVLNRLIAANIYYTSIQMCSS